MNLPPLIGLQKTSLIDYPGRVASLLFLPGCNMRCPYCHNSDLALGRTEDLLDRNDVIAFVKNRAPLLGGVVITGGEPLLYEGLSDLIALIKKETSLPVKLDTNGLLPGRLEGLIPSSGCPDFIAMDIKTIPSLYSGFGGSSDSGSAIRRSIAIINKSGIPAQYRSTAHPLHIHTGMIDELSELIRETDDYVLNPFKPGNCLNRDYNNHPGTRDQDLTELRDGFISRGVKCRVPSIQYSGNTF